MPNSYVMVMERNVNPALSSLSFLRLLLPSSRSSSLSLPPPPPLVGSTNSISYRAFNSGRGPAAVSLSVAPFASRGRLLRCRCCPSRRSSSSLSSSKKIVNEISTTRNVEGESGVVRRRWGCYQREREREQRAGEGEVDSTFIWRKRFVEATSATG